jgi:hypothetical protein
MAVKMIFWSPRSAGTASRGQEPAENSRPVREEHSLGPPTPNALTREWRAEVGILIIGGDESKGLSQGKGRNQGWGWERWREGGVHGMGDRYPSMQSIQPSLPSMQRT